jgi:hypothetical protein
LAKLGTHEARPDSSVRPLQFNQVLREARAPSFANAVSYAIRCFNVITNS